MAATGTLDQSQTSALSTQSIGNISVTTSWKQQITIGVDSNVSDITFKLYRIGSPTDNIEVTIYSDSGSDTPSAAISDTVSIAASSISTSSSGTDYVFTFTTLPAVTIGTKIWAVIERSGAFNASHYIRIFYDYNAPYTGGIFGYGSTPTGFTESVGNDAYFLQYYTTGGGGGGSLSSINSNYSYLRN